MKPLKNGTKVSISHKDRYNGRRHQGMTIEGRLLHHEAVIIDSWDDGTEIKYALKYSDGTTQRYISPSKFEIIKP